MATKPTQTITVRATNANYVGGPPALQGTATKIEPVGGVADGWQGDQKPPAQWENYLNYPRDLWTVWVEQGSFVKLLNPHIIEANADGTIFASAADFGDTSSDDEGLKVRPNNGSGETGILCEVQYDKPGGIFRGSSVDPGARPLIAEQDAASGVAFEAKGLDNSGAILATSFGFSTVIQATAQSDGGKGMIVTGRQNVISGSGNEIKNIGPGINLKVGYQGASNIGGLGIDVKGGDGDGSVAGGDGVRAIGGINGGNGPGTGLRASSDAPEGSAIIATNLAVTASGNVINTQGAVRAVPILATQSGGKMPAGVFQTTSVAVDISAPIRLVPQAFNLLAEGVQNGSMWFYEDSAEYRPRFHGATSQWFSYSTDPSCFAFVDNVDDDTSGVATTETDISGASAIQFVSQGIPIGTGDVRIRVNFRIKKDDATIPADDYQMIINDVTAGDITIFTIIGSMAKGEGGDDIFTEHTREFRYTLPAAGQRVFKFRHQKLTGANGSIAMEGLNVVIEPYQRM